VRYPNPGALHVVFGPTCKLARYDSGDRIVANLRNMCFILMALCAGVASLD
jgi:hypothetical protein